MPLCFHYEAAMKQFPNAKIVLTVRDTPEVWYNSIKIVQTYTRGSPIPWFEMFGKQLPGYLSQIGPRFDLRDSGPKLNTLIHKKSSSNREMFAAAMAEDTAVEFYNQWIEKARRTVIFLFLFPPYCIFSTPFF